MAILKAETLICPLWIAQIAALHENKAFTKIPFEYSDNADIFWTNLAMEPPENTYLNKYIIKLIKRK